MNEKIEDFFYNIKFYYDIIKYGIINFGVGIKNIISYAPLIYKDRDWDYSYLDIMIKFKLKRMSKILTKNNRHTCTEQNVKQINFCIKLLDRLEANDYTHPDYEKVLEERVLTGIARVDFNLKNLYTEEEFKIWMEWENHWRSRDRRLLYQVFYKYIEEWWD